jgi:hypothetical protein
MRMKLFELPHLAIGSPTLIAMPGVPQINASNLLETARRVKARGELVGDPFILDEAILTRQADRLFVKVLSVKFSVFKARDLGPNQGNAIFKILRTV